MKKTVIRFTDVFALCVLFYVAPVALSTGCQTLYTGTVTLTKIVRSAADEYAALYNQHLVSPEVAEKVAVAHQEWRKASGVAADTLTAYKLGQTADVKGTLEAARIAASHFIDVLVPILSKQRTTEFRAQIQKASGV